MKQYTKINTIFKRDEKTKRIVEGDYSLPEFDYLKDNKWIFTEKVDGTNIRVMWNGDRVVFGGKTDEASIPVFLLYKLQELFEGTIKRQLFLEKFGTEGGVCLYGEGYGNKIQKAGSDYIKDGVDFILFDVKIGDWFLERENIEDIAKQFNLKVVPIIGEGNLTEAVEMTRKGFKSQWGDFTAEGIVARPRVELKTRKGDRVITKIKYRDFILFNFCRTIARRKFGKYTKK
uniref:Putative RNA ligase n=1 Tax=viral metagenome TaxID=1070528 RepID=A0A6M3JMA9_9ZZZZ